MYILVSNDKRPQILKNKDFTLPPSSSTDQPINPEEAADAIPSSSPLAASESPEIQSQDAPPSAWGSAPSLRPSSHSRPPCPSFGPLSDSQATQTAGRLPTSFSTAKPLSDLLRFMEWRSGGSARPPALPAFRPLMLRCPRIPRRTAAPPPPRQAAPFCAKDHGGRRCPPEANPTI